MITKTVTLPDLEEFIMANGKSIKLAADEVQIFITEDTSTFAMSPYRDGQKLRDEILKDDDGREVHLLFDVTVRWVSGANKGATQKLTVRFDRAEEFEAGDVLVSGNKDKDAVVVYTPSGRKNGDFVNMSATLDSADGWIVDHNMWNDQDIDDYTGSKSDYSAV